jgi:hypothetical protein
MKTRGSPRDRGFEEVWPPSSLDSNRKDNLLRGVSERDVTGPPTTRAAPDHLHLGGVDKPPHGGLQEGLQLVQVEPEGGRGC